MPVLRDLSEQITRALGVRELKVEPIAQSSANLTMLMRGDGQAFFAKIFTDADPTKLNANQRYDREKAILSKTWPVGVPQLVYSADTERVLVTREVKGYGFKHYRDADESLEALGKMAGWLAGFHAAAEVQPKTGSLWDDFSQYAEFRETAGFPALIGTLSDYPLKEYVLSKGDCMAANFKFTPSGVVGLDFEGVAFRPKEYDLVALLQGLSRLTGESVPDMSAMVVQQYHAIRPIDDVAATIAVVTRLVELTDY